jgi:hypothetical protein
MLLVCLDTNFIIVEVTARSLGPKVAGGLPGTCTRIASTNTAVLTAGATACHRARL